MRGDQFNNTLVANVKPMFHLVARLGALRNFSRFVHESSKYIKYKYYLYRMHAQDRSQGTYIFGRIAHNNIGILRVIFSRAKRRN